MKRKNEFNNERIVDLPVSPVLKIMRQQEEPEDMEAIEWSEVRRILWELDWKPIMDLPMSKSERLHLHRQMEDGVDTSAFASMDFKRTHGLSNDPHRRKLAALKEERRNVLIKFELILEHIESPAKYQILKYVKQGIIEIKMCEDKTMFLAAKLYVRLLDIEERIREVKDARQRRFIRRGLIADQRILSCRNR